MSMQINKSAYEKLIKEDIEWLLSNTKDSLERRHIVEVLNYSPERLYASGSSEIPNDLEEAAGEYEKKHTYQRYDGGGLTPEYDATLAEAVIFGAKWQAEKDARNMYMSDNRHFEKVYELGKKDMKEQMIRSAVEGYLVADGLNDLQVKTANLGDRGYYQGQKVRVIIVEEEGK